MSTDPTAVNASSNLIERVKNILLQPRAEWDRIAVEPANTTGLYTGYLLPLAALAALCGLVGMSVFGYSFMGVTVRVPIVAGLASAVVRVVMTMVGAYLLAFITNMLAPNFGSQPDMGQAQKLAVYSGTAGLIAGVFAIIPALAVLSILGLYSLALLYLGLPRLMKTPEDKRIGYFATIIVVCIVLGLVASVVFTALSGALGGLGMMRTGAVFNQ